MLAHNFKDPPVPKLAQQIGGSNTRYAPLKLKQILALYGVRQSEWCSAIIQQGGRGHGQGLSQPMGTVILNWGIWPQCTPKESIKDQTLAFLRQRGVPEEELSDSLWDEELNEIDRGAIHKPMTTTRKPQAATPGAKSISDNELPEVQMLSQAAKKHFKLFRDPFQDDVQSPDDVFLSDAQRHIREAMFITAKHGGFLAVVGESGAGKSVLRRDLIDRINREKHPITYIMPRIIDKERLTAGAICDAIIQDVSLERPGRTLEAKARQIERLLGGSSNTGNSHVLIIEEAHDLKVQTLKYLKRFWELEDGFRKLLAIILIGQPELKAKLDERQNWEAREVIRRIELAELPPLNGDLEGYLTLKFNRLDRPLESIFENDAFDEIRKRLTLRDRKGDALHMQYPLVVNNLVVKCMNTAVELGVSKINAELIREV